MVHSLSKVTSDIRWFSIQDKFSLSYAVSHSEAFILQIIQKGFSSCNRFVVTFTTFFSNSCLPYESHSSSCGMTNFFVWTQTSSHADNFSVFLLLRELCLLCETVCHRISSGRQPWGICFWCFCKDKRVCSRYSFHRIWPTVQRLRHPVALVSWEVHSSAWWDGIFASPEECRDSEHLNWGFAHRGREKIGGLFHCIYLIRDSSGTRFGCKLLTLSVLC